MDTTVIIPWLKENYDYDVIAVAVDVGQGEELSPLNEKAIKSGASKIYIEDVREEFVTDCIWPTLQMGAVYEQKYLLGTSFARPVIAKRLVEIARKEGAVAIAHGATGKGNDQVRFELSVNALAPDLQIIAPWREWDLMSRTALIAFAEKHDIPLSSSNKHYSMDRNMLHCSFEGGELEDPWEEPGPNSYVMAVPVEQAPNEPEYITIGFEKGDAVTLNGERLTPRQMMEQLNKIAGKHGIGRLDMVENRFVGMKSRGVYETPAGTVLYIAHKDLEGICLDREALATRETILPRYAAAIYNGFWFSPEREAMQALIDQMQQGVTGEVRLKLYKGNAWPVGRYSPHSLYCQDLATFEECATYDHKDAAGFIRLQGLRIRGYADRLEHYKKQG